MTLSDLLRFPIVALQGSRSRHSNPALLSTVNSSHDLESGVYDDLGLVQLNVVPRVVDCEPFSASRHRRNLVVQVYPEFILRIALLLGFGWTSRRRRVCQDNDWDVAERSIGCAYLVGAREPNVLLLRNPRL